MENSLMVIYPYLHKGMWVFDDDAVGLVKEPFVAGIPEILEALLLRENVKNPEQGFRLMFSASPFPGHQLHGTHLREEMGGNWYGATFPEGSVEGWLCPALFKYFTEAPENLYIRVENEAPFV